MPAHSAQDGLVLVTGATGFVASHVIQQLQEKGYRVRATLRSLTKDPIIVAAIKALAPNARFPIELVEADLTSPKGWDDAVAGCVGIFHIAAAVVMTSPNPEKDILEPSIQGVKHVFEAARRAKTVKKIVMTSSVAAIYHAAKEGKVYTEDDWNSESTLVTAPYNYSKTQAEKWAWDFVKNLPEAEKIELETINPALILGPQLLNKEAPAQAILTRILDAQMPFIPRFGFGVVDVRDVALAHINSYERDGGGNRYVLVSGSMYMTEMAKVLAEYFPGRPIPTKSGPYIIFFLVFLFSRTLSVQFLRKSWDRCFVCDNTRSRTVLGLRYRSTKEALETSAESMRQFGLIKTQQEVVAAVRTKRIVMAVSVAAIGVATAFFVRKYLL